MGQLQGNSLLSRNCYLGRVAVPRARGCRKDKEMSDVPERRRVAYYMLDLARERAGLFLGRMT